MRLRSLRDSILLDAVAAAAFLVVGVVDAFDDEIRDGPVWAHLVFAVALSAAVLLRRREPVPTSYAFLALLIAASAVITSPEDLTLPLFGLLLFPYAIGAHASREVAAVWLPACLAVILMVSSSHDSALTFADITFPSALAIASLLAGRAAASRSQLAAELHEAALRAEEEREAEAHRAVAAERRRIAREMHDVVAHSISVMVVQAGGARRILERAPERAEEAAAEIERTGREALLEMRRLLGVLRGPEQTGQLAPSPTFDGLEALVERARTAGLPVELAVEGEPRPLAPGVDLAAYRVVQEALTNALQHAPGATTTVHVLWRADALELEIADRGPGQNPRKPPPATAQGLIGMRERVALYGGELSAGPRRGGGFEVRVRLPLEATSAPDSTTPVVQGAA